MYFDEMEYVYFDYSDNESEVIYLIENKCHGYSSKDYGFIFFRACLSCNNNIVDWFLREKRQEIKEDNIEDGYFALLSCKRRPPYDREGKERILLCLKLFHKYNCLPILDRSRSYFSYMKRIEDVIIKEDLVEHLLSNDEFERFLAEERLKFLQMDWSFIYEEICYCSYRNSVVWKLWSQIARSRWFV